MFATSPTRVRFAVSLQRGGRLPCQPISFRLSPCHCGGWTTQPGGKEIHVESTSCCIGTCSSNHIHPSIACTISSLSAVPFGSCSDVRVVYTPPLYWTPHSGGPAPSLTPPTILGPSKLKLSVLATGHCVEVNLASDVAVFCGSQQVKFIAILSSCASTSTKNILLYS